MSSDKPQTSSAVATQKPGEKNTRPSALAIMASRLSIDPAKLLTTLKATVFQKANDEEVMALVMVANEYQLNPLLKEIYAFPGKGGGIVPIVSVDGWNKMLVRHPDFDGIEFEFHDNDGELFACTATIAVKNRSKPVRITEYLNECKRNTDPWNSMPRRMLRNRTLCQAARLAFGFSGVMNDDEASTVTIETSVVTEPPPNLVTAPKDNITPQQELETLILGAGFTFSDLQKWGKESGNIEEADSLPGFAEVPSDVCTRLLRAKVGLIKGLEKLKGAS